MIHRFLQAIDSEVRRAHIFGTSALEIMLVITFLLALLFAAFSLAEDAERSGNHLTRSPTSPTSPAQERQELARERLKLAKDRRNLATERGDFAREREDFDEKRKEVEKERKDLIEERADLVEERADLDEERAKLDEEREEPAEERPEPGEPSSDQDDDGSGHRWPPIIRLPESDGYKFRIGSSDLTRSFRRTLTREVCDRIIQIANDFEADVIEVIGHTDEQPYPPSDKGNLDRTLIPYMNGETVNLVVTDNVGLGMARAAAVARVLRGCLRSAPSGPFMVVALSAGQTLLPHDGGIADGSDSGDNPERRRIEIRVRRRDTRDTTN